MRKTTREDDGLFGYERLRVRKKAAEFAVRVYSVTRTFPREEMFGLTTQLRRSAVSVAGNIAEGASRSSARDQSRFLEIAYGSLNELATMLHIAHGQGFVDAGQFAELRSEISVMCRMLSGLKRAALEPTGSRSTLNTKRSTKED